MSSPGPQGPARPAPPCPHQLSLPLTHFPPATWAPSGRSDVQVQAALCLECSSPGTHLLPTLISSVWRVSPPCCPLNTPHSPALPCLHSSPHPLTLARFHLFVVCQSVSRAGARTVWFPAVSPGSGTGPCTQDRVNKQRIKWLRSLPGPPPPSLGGCQGHHSQATVEEAAP